MFQVKNQKEANFIRLLLLIEQQWTCPVTGYRLTMANSVLDHDHKTGLIRGVLFNGANRVLQDEQWVRFGIRRENHVSMLRAMADYLEREQFPAAHHTHRDPISIVTVTSYKQLGTAIIKDKGKLPHWWGYVYRGNTAAQRLTKRLSELYEKYSIEPRFYAQK